MRVPARIPCLRARTHPHGLRPAARRPRSLARGLIACGPFLMPNGLVAYVSWPMAGGVAYAMWPLTDGRMAGGLWPVTDGSWPAPCGLFLMVCFLCLFLMAYPLWPMRARVDLARWYQNRSRPYIGPISASPTACPMRGYGRAGT